MDLKEQRQQVWQRMDELFLAAQDDGSREFTADEARAYAGLESELRDLDDRLSVSQRARDHQQPGAPRLAAGVGFGKGKSARYGVPLGADHRLGDLPDGSGDRFTDGDFGRYMRGILTGDWNGVDDTLRSEFRSQTEGTSNKGGHLVPTPLASFVLDKARNASRAFQAGVRTVPMDAQTLKIAKVATDPVPAWRSEEATIAESDMTFGVVTFTARSLGVLVKASWELIEDAANFSTELESALASAFALELDRTVLFGSGTAPEPGGIYNTSGITKTALGANGGAIDWDDVIDAVQRVQAANYDAPALIHHSRTEAGLGKLKDANGAYLAPPAYVSDVRRLVTSQIPITQTQGTANNASSLFVGDFSPVLVGMRTTFRVVPLRERYAETGQVGFIGWMRADVQLARTDSVQVVNGIIP